MGIADIRETIESCKHCFMCRHACPTFLATKLDSHTPRGYALLLSEIDHGLQAWTPAIVERFYQCSQCGLCREDCAYHWAEDEVVRNGREEIVRQGKEPARVKEIAARIAELGSPYPPRPAPGPAAAPPAPKRRGGVEVLYFPGCSARRNHPQIVQAVGRILQAMRVDWTTFEEERCCGLPLFELGYTEQAIRAAAETAEAIQAMKPEILLTGCPHCLRAFRELYPRWKIEWPGDLRLLHAAQLFGGRLDRRELSLRAGADLPRLGYHDPCQLGRKLGEYDAPRRLLAALGGRPPAELFHGREKAECCGAGSVMFLTDPDICRKVARNRLNAAVEAGAEVLVTACQNCKSALDAANGPAARIRVADICEVIAGLL